MVERIRNQIFKRARMLPERSRREHLNTLFEHENCVSIKPYYYRYKDKATGEIKDNYSDIVRNISRSFTDKKSMRDKVVNKTYTDWFSED